MRPRLHQPKLKYSVAEIEDLTGESHANVYKAIKAGHLATFLVGRRRFPVMSDVEKWIAFLKKESDRGRPVQYQAREVA